MSSAARRAVTSVIEHLVAAFPDGVVRRQRIGHASCPTTRRLGADASWERAPTSTFALLEAASALGKPCAAATREWSATRRKLRDLLDAGQIVG
jgi:hypothetical protein